jgi:hypothetical protein
MSLKIEMIEIKGRPEEAASKIVEHIQMAIERETRRDNAKGDTRFPQVPEGWRPYLPEDVSLDWVGKTLDAFKADRKEPFVRSLISEIFWDSDGDPIIKLGPTDAGLDPCCDNALRTCRWTDTGLPFGKRIEQPEGEPKE